MAYLEIRYTQAHPRQGHCVYPKRIGIALLDLDTRYIDIGRIELTDPGLGVPSRTRTACLYGVRNTQTLVGYSNVPRSSGVAHHGASLSSGSCSAGEYSVLPLVCT